jgi:hypothetical protein
VWRWPNDGALKARDKSFSKETFNICRAFSASQFINESYPGRWPGLLHFAPLALRNPRLSALMRQVCHYPNQGSCTCAQTCFRRPGAGFLQDGNRFLQAFGEASATWQVASAPWQVVSATWQVVSAPWQVVSATWRVVSAPWCVVSAPWQVVSAMWRRLLHVGGRFLPGDGGRLQGGKRLVLTNWRYLQVARGGPTATA